ncbi:MAG: M20 family metallopeptidase [Clostridia bacterium]|nr:M20 family metallopeptidase [Clostridia bacterium]
MDLNTICNLIDKHQDELYQMLSDMIQINSENYGTGGNEEECARYIHKLCQKAGFESDLYSPLSLDGFENHPDYLPGKNLENRYNVTATWRGEEDVNEVMLMAHTDTVMFGDLANWKKHPLSGDIENGNIYGRGATDDKYGIALSIFLMKLLKDAGFKPKKNLLFSAYVDEELGGSHGAMAAVMKYPTKRIVNIDGGYEMLVPSATGGGVVTYRFHTKSTVDSAEPTAMGFPIVMEEMKKFFHARRDELQNNPYYKDTFVPETSLRYNEIRAGNSDMDKDIGVLQFTFYTDKTKEEIYKEFVELEQSISKKLAPLGLVGDGFTPDSRFFHYGVCPPDSEDVKLMVEAAKEVGMDMQVCAGALSDMSVLLKYGSNATFTIGASRLFHEVGGAHQPNEFIECEKLLKLTKSVAAYILKVLG